jgi:putative hydrolase of the HAD superfamily
MSWTPHWIAFDAVGTLIFADPPVHLAYYRSGRRYGSQLRPEEVRRRFQEAFSRRGRLAAASGEPMGNAVSSEASAPVASACTEASEREFWRSVVADVLPDVTDAEACFEELFAHFARPQSWQVFADVEETLAEARQRGIRLAIASNFDARLHAVCDGLPELGLIERRCVSSEIGHRKPEPAFFQRLLRECGCAASELLVIGDEFETDVAAARSMGIRALHLDRSAAGDDGQLSSLTELWTALDAG